MQVWGLSWERYRLSISFAVLRRLTGLCLHGGFRNDFPALYCPCPHDLQQNTPFAP